jgi:Domain of unknown function (DUF3576)
MLVAHYRLSAALAASLSLTLLGCGLSLRTDPAAATASAASAAPSAGAANVQPAKEDPPGEMDTEATIWTVLGLAKKPSEHEPGPQTGSTVSPILWQAARDTLNFVKFSSSDPLTGLLVSEWYSPKDKPDERYKINVFILSRELRSDSLAVTVDRQVRSATGQWEATTIARKVEDDLENAILLRAGQLKRTWLKEWKSG